MNPVDYREETVRIYADNPAVYFRTRHHVLGADLVEQFDMTGGSERVGIQAWCDCGWKAEIHWLTTLARDVEAVTEEDLEAAVKPWRQHVRMSGRLYRTHSRLAREEREQRR